MHTLAPDEVLFYPGSLLSENDELVAPYDLEASGEALQGFRPALSEARFNNANAAPFRLDWHRISTLHVVNGMGVTLGDSIIGLTAIHAIKEHFPNVRVCLYRPQRAPAYVEELYALATGIVIDERVTLPCTLARVPFDEVVVDIGNHLFWRSFASEPMIDFFLDALGVDPGAIDAHQKRNSWLTRLVQANRHFANAEQPYALFCPTASTPLRSIPATHRARLVDLIHRAYGLPVLGFGAVEHHAYRDINAENRTTAEFLRWVGNAAFVMTGDTAALHIAAGFDVPTTAFFSSIEPRMRARDYPRCHSVSLNVPTLRGLQASSRAADLEVLDEAFEQLLSAGLTLPRLSS
jgi:hypothetical protein